MCGWDTWYSTADDSTSTALKRRTSASTNTRGTKIGSFRQTGGGWGSFRHTRGRRNYSAVLTQSSLSSAPAAIVPPFAPCLFYAPVPVSPTLGEKLAAWAAWVAAKTTMMTMMMTRYVHFLFLVLLLFFFCFIAAKKTLRPRNALLPIPFTTGTRRIHLSQNRCAPLVRSKFVFFDGVPAPSVFRSTCIAEEVGAWCLFSPAPCCVFPSLRVVELAMTPQFREACVPRTKLLHTRDFLCSRRQRVRVIAASSVNVGPNATRSVSAPILPIPVIRAPHLRSTPCNFRRIAMTRDCRTLKTTTNSSQTLNPPPPRCSEQRARPCLRRKIHTSR